MSVDRTSLVKVPAKIRESFYEHEIAELSEEVRAWLSTTLEDEVADPLLVSLADGQVLKRLVRHFFPKFYVAPDSERLKRIAQKYGHSSYESLESIHFFLAVCRRICGLPDDLLFDEADLYSVRDRGAVGKLDNIDEDVRERNVLLTISLFAGWLDAHGATEWDKHRGEFVVTESDTMYFAIIRGNIEKVLSMLEANKDNAQAPSTSGWCPVYTAVWFDKVDLVRHLLANGATANQPTQDFWYPIHAAAYRNHAACARILIDAGAEVDEYAPSGATALYYAAAAGHTDMVNLLVTEGKANTEEAREAEVYKPIHGAVHHRHAETLAKLIELGADPAARFHKKRYTILHLSIADASNGGRVFLPRVLDIVKDAPLDARNSHGVTALGLAAIHGELDAVKLLIAKGADATLTDDSSHSPAELAVRNGHKDVADELIRYTGEDASSYKYKPTKIHALRNIRAPPSPFVSEDEVEEIAKSIVKHKSSKLGAVPAISSGRRASKKSVDLAKKQGRVRILA